MNKMRRLFSAVLVLALCLGLCACDPGVTRLFSRPLSLEEKLTRSAEQMEQVKSMHVDMDVDMAMTLSVGGRSEDLKLDTRCGMDVQTDPLKLYMEMELSMPAFEEKILNYVEQDGDSLTAYSSSDGGATWKRSTIPSLEDVAPQDPIRETELFLACAESFTETGTETVNGSRATVYSGFISGRYAEEAIKASGTLDSIAQALGGELSQEMFRDLSDIPATLAIDDDSGMLVRYTLDMGRVMQELMERLMNAVLAPYGLGEDAFSLEMEKMTVGMTISRFNDIDEIVIPQAARAA